MTREEAIKILTETQVFYFAQYGKEKTQEALDMAIEALDEREVELFDDGTLVVNVKEGEKVDRVLIDGDDHFGGLYYIDAELKHGEWEYDGEYTRCSNCGFVLDTYMQGVFYTYCPRCGADMRGDEE